jgi:ribosome-associated toxin RatA of RatAB toxin-antitoxin module
MIARPRRLETTLLTTALLLTVLPLSAGDISDKELARLKKGEVLIEANKLEGGGVIADAKGMIFAPIDEVWAIIEKCEDYEKTMPRIEEGKELTRKGNVVTCEVEADLPFPLPNLTSTTRATHTVKPDSRLREWTLIKGDYKKNAGYWKLTSHDGGKSTLAEYHLELELDLPVPDGLLAGAQSRTLPKLFKGLREQTRPKK